MWINIIRVWISRIVCYGLHPGVIIVIGHNSDPVEYNAQCISEAEWSISRGCDDASCMCWLCSSAVSSQVHTRIVNHIQGICSPLSSLGHWRSQACPRLDLVPVLYPVCLSEAVGKVGFTWKYVATGTKFAYHPVNISMGNFDGKYINLDLLIMIQEQTIEVPLNIIHHREFFIFYFRSCRN